MYKHNKINRQILKSFKLVFSCKRPIKTNWYQLPVYKNTFKTNEEPWLNSCLLIVGFLNLRWRASLIVISKAFLPASIIEKLSHEKV